MCSSDLNTEVVVQSCTTTLQLLHPLNIELTLNKNLLLCAPLGYVITSLISGHAVRRPVFSGKIRGDSEDSLERRFPHGHSVALKKKRRRVEWAPRCYRMAPGQVVIC